MNDIHPNHYTADDVAALLTDARGREAAEEFEALRDASEAMLMEAGQKDDRALLLVAEREYAKVYDLLPYRGVVGKHNAVALLKVLGLVPVKLGGILLWERGSVDAAIGVVRGAMERPA